MLAEDHVHLEHFELRASTKMAEAEKVLRMFSRNLSLLSRSRVLPLRSGHVEINTPGGVSQMGSVAMPISLVL